MKKSRSGFMLLMLVAFSSIILGLSVTFYLYCTRSLEDGQYAVRYANQRLALRAAINYLTANTSATPVSKIQRANASAVKYQSTGYPTKPSSGNIGPWVDINGVTSRGQNAGYYRIKMGGNNTVVCITAGSGPSNGYPAPVVGGTTPPGWTDAKWNLEVRRYYFVTLESVALAQFDYLKSGPVPPVIKSLDGMYVPNAAPDSTYW